LSTWREPQKPLLDGDPGQPLSLVTAVLQASNLQLRGRVTYRFRRPDVLQQADGRYLDDLAAIKDPTPGKRMLQHLMRTEVSGPQTF
jgi:hypothetical protein